MASACLLELSHELLHCIFSEVDPVDLSSLSKTCHPLRGYIRGNRLLHKDLYVRRYDEPGTSEAEVDWEEHIHDLVKLEKILQSDNRQVKSDHLGFAADQLNHLIETAHTEGDDTKNLDILAEYFKDTNNSDAFLCASDLFSRAGSEHQQAAATPELRQASAKLHCMYGVPIDRIPSRNSASFSPHRRISTESLSLSPSACTRLQSRPYLTHPYARSKVYDLRQYNDHTLWGPFMADGSQRVDWEKVEAVMIVLGFNLRKFTERSEGRWPRVWHRPFVGATPNSYLSLPAMPAHPDRKEPDEDMAKIRELALALDARDPYGITGTWMRVVCFLDYNDLYAFNFSARIPDDQPREPIDTEEAIRLIRIKLQVTRIDPPGSDDDDEEAAGMDWSQFKGTRLPVVHFWGDSKSLHASWDPNANSRIRGTVRQTPEGDIRWTTFSIFHGEERWRSEGIQVGGLRSARGVLGNWFDKDYDMHGPAGPTAFWKERDDVGEERDRGGPMAFF